MADESFFQAARSGDAQAVINRIARDPSLLAAKEPVNGWTALHLLARLSLALPVQQLLSLGADPEARDAAFRSALHLAASADASAAGAASTSASSNGPHLRAIRRRSVHWRNLPLFVHCSRAVRA